MIGKYKTNLLEKKYLIPNTLKERVGNFKSLPRYCPVMLCLKVHILLSINNLLPTAFLDDDAVILEKNDERDKVVIVRKQKNKK